MALHSMRLQLCMHALHNTTATPHPHISSARKNAMSSCSSFESRLLERDTEIGQQARQMARLQLGRQGTLVQHLSSLRSIVHGGRVAIAVRSRTHHQTSHTAGCGDERREAAPASKRGAPS
jgi:hypothetical protein